MKKKKNEKKTTRPHKKSGSFAVQFSSLLTYLYTSSIFSPPLSLAMKLKAGDYFPVKMEHFIKKTILAAMDSRDHETVKA